MTKKVALAGICIALLVGVAWLWKALSARPGDSTSARPPVGTPPASENPAPRATAVQLSPDPEQRAPASVDSPKDSSGFAIEGSIVVLDPSGGEHPSEDGSFTVLFLGSGDNVWRRVDVEHGRWTSRATEGAKFRIARVELGGRAALLDPPLDPAAVPPDHRLLLRAKWPPSTFLHVRGADTGQELTGVEVIRGMSLGSSGSTCPGPYAQRDVLAASATSPIRLDEIDPLDLGFGAQRFFARANGYAWASLEIDLAVGSEVQLLLPPGGSLAVDLTGPMPPPELGVLCVRPSNSPDAWPPEATRSLEGHASCLLESLAAGRHLVSVELASADVASSVLGSGEVEIVAGSTAHLAISLREIAATDKAPLEGIVVVPKDWRIDEFRLMAFSVGRSTALPGDHVPPLQSGSMHPVEGQPEARAFSWPAVPVGSYALTVLPPGWATRVDVGPQGLRNARIELPPPALVSVRVVDVGNGTEAPVGEVHWNAIRPEDSGGAFLFCAVKNPSSGRHEFSAPIGEVEITVADPRYLPFAKRVTVGPGRNDLTIEIEQACGIVLEVREGNLAVPFDDGNVSIEQVGGDGRSNWNTKEDGAKGMKFAVTHPGRYRVEVGGLAGYRQVGKVVLEIESGKFAEVVVQVERQP